MNWHEIEKIYDVLVSRVELNPEIVFQIAQIKDINALVDAMGPDDFGEDERLPYWSSLWPVSVCLAKHLINHPTRIRSQAIELGCGLGLVSLALASTGVEILATDYEPEACAFSAHNASLNQQNIQVRQWDWRELSRMSSKFNTIVGADVLYEPRNARPVAEAIDALMAPGGTAFIADPNRPHWPQFQDILLERGMDVSVTHGESHVIIQVKRIIDINGSSNHL
jgi:predicted nicotinamide N-methyase